MNDYTTKNGIQMVGLLPASRLDHASRVKLLMDLESLYLKKKDVESDVLEIDEEDFLCSYPVYDNFKRADVPHKVLLLRSFLTLITNVTRKSSGETIIFDYKNREYVVPALFVRSFMHHQVYLFPHKVQELMSDYDLGVSRVVELLPARKEVVDGQMKIMVDAVLALDGVVYEEEKREGYKILIVGSSHEPGVLPRSSYYPLFYMVTNSEFDLYDPLEEDGEECINGNVVRRYRKPYMYNSLLMYDLVIDDAWINGKTSLESIVRLKSTSMNVLDMYPAHYSLKSFGNAVPGTYYHQVGSTLVGERRLVSRRIVPRYYDNVLLGKCAFCRELKYMMKHSDYDQLVYERIMMVHREGNFSCVPEALVHLRMRMTKLKYKPLIAEWVESSLYVVQGGKVSMPTEPNRVIRRLIYDPRLANDPVELREEHLRMLDVAISDRSYFIEELKNAQTLLLVQGAKVYERSTNPLTHVQLQEETVSYIHDVSVQRKKNTEKDRIRKKKQQGMTRNRVWKMQKFKDKKTVQDVEQPLKSSEVSKLRTEQDLQSLAKVKKQEDHLERNYQDRWSDEE